MAKPVLHGRDHGLGGADPAPGVHEITSDDASVTITNPDGPITDLSVPAGDGIQYDTDNEGDWLDVTATGQDADGWGMQFTTTDDGDAAGMKFQSAGETLMVSQGVFEVSAHGIGITNAGSGEIITLSTPAGEIDINGNGVTNTDIKIGLGTDHLAFFGQPPVAQQATPVTLADVIALLQAYGLCP